MMEQKTYDEENGLSASGELNSEGTGCCGLTCIAQGSEYIHFGSLVRNLPTPPLPPRYQSQYLNHALSATRPIQPKTSGVTHRRRSTSSSSDRGCFGG